MLPCWPGCTAPARWLHHRLPGLARLDDLVDHADPDHTRQAADDLLLPGSQLNLQALALAGRPDYPDLGSSRVVTAQR